MNVQCPQCRSVYRVDPDRVPPAGVRARCSRCGEIIAVTRPGAAPAPALATQRVGLAEVSAAAAAALRAGAVAPPVAVPAEPMAPPAAAAPVRSDPVRPEPPLHRPAQHGREVAASTSPTASGGSPRPAAAGATRGGVSRAAASDPDARARRIARALVSDIVVYHKERCERSLQMGTLRTEFKEEILKSWEEYVQQVGLEMARSTPYFRDALNEILAKGQKVF